MANINGLAKWLNINGNGKLMAAYHQRINSINGVAQRIGGGGSISMASQLAWQSIAPKQSGLK
jgi:hypothetical protein